MPTRWQGQRALTCALWLCLAGLAAAKAVQEDLKVTRCEDVALLGPEDDKCEFVREHCKADSLVNYLEAYYCHVAPHGWKPAWGMVAGCTCLLLLLFRVTARTSDDFFSLILSQISQDMGLPPRLGGVTLLALGNGAPDLSSSIAAVKTGNYRMALGSLTGGGMFVGCVVAGRILTLNNGAKARWAQIRDVTFYLASVVTVAGIVASGSFGYGGVLALLLLYSGYVVVVAVADFTKRMGVEWDQEVARVARNISRRFSRRREAELGSPLLPRSPGAASQQLSDVSEGASPTAREAHAVPDDDQLSVELSETAGQSRVPRFGRGPHWPSYGSVPTVHEMQEIPRSRSRSVDRMQVYLAQQQEAAPLSLSVDTVAGAAAAAAVAEHRGQEGGPGQGAGEAGLARLLVRGRHTFPAAAERSYQHQSSAPAAFESAPAAFGSAPADVGSLALAAGRAGSSASSGGRSLASHASTTAAGARRRFTLPAWLQHTFHALQHGEEHAHPDDHIRRGPTVAAFQPRIRYDQLVRMPAREYRRRALAEMAQSRSFYVRGPEGGSEAGEEAGAGSGSRTSRASRASHDLEQGYVPPAVPASPPRFGWASPPPAPQRGGALRSSQQAQQGQHAQQGQQLEGPESPEGQPMQELFHHLYPEEMAQREGAAAHSMHRAHSAHAMQPQQHLPPIKEQASPPSPGRPGSLGSAAAAGERSPGQLPAGTQSPGAAGSPPVAPFSLRGQQQEQQHLLQQPAVQLEKEGEAAAPHGSVRFEGVPSPGAPPVPVLPPPLQHRHTHYSSYEFGGVPLPAGEAALHPEGPEEEEELEEEGGPEPQQEPGPLGRAVAVVEAPIMLALQATVPMIEPSSYRRQWFLASMACSPLFICAYLGQLHWLGLLVATAVGGGLAAAATAGTRALGNKPPLWSCGMHFPVGAALVAVYGFAVSAMWIALFAGEIVALLHFLGVLGRMDPAVLGLTVLAWGNSLMDYMNNTSMAGRSAGGNSMAMTACYAGPLFNMLVALGLGFWVLLDETGAAAVAVRLPRTAAVGCACIVVACAAVVAVALSCNHWLPQRFGWVLIGWYGVYILLALLVTFI